MAQNIRLTDKVSNVNEEEELRKRGFILGVTLGEGSYAKVKSAYSEQHNKKVALKIINRKKAPKDFQQRFLPRELDILKRLNHPNVIQLVEIMHFNHKVYIAMEMAGHGDLLEYIKLRGAVPEDKAKHMFNQLVMAIEYLHGIKVIHRDLKCENILLDKQNNIKISDFGFARIMNKDDISKTFCGSAAYAAPEILQGIPYTGHAYDIWSIGVILYIMVCGSMPYDDSNIKKMIKYQTERKVSFSRSKKISELCKHLVHRMLEADISQRASIAQVQKHPWLDAAKAKASDGTNSTASQVVQESPTPRRVSNVSPDPHTASRPAPVSPHNKVPASQNNDHTPTGNTDVNAHHTAKTRETSEKHDRKKSQPGATDEPMEMQ